MAAPWLRNGSYMVFRRFEQKVPEFREFVKGHSARLGMEPDLLGARMFGRWKGGAPLELAPLHDNSAIGARRQAQQRLRLRRRPGATQMSVRGAYPQSSIRAMTRRRRSRSPEAPHHPPRHHLWSRGGVRRNDHHAQPRTDVRLLPDLDRAPVRVHPAQPANDPGFVSGKVRPGSDAPVTPGFDPIIGQAPIRARAKWTNPFRIIRRATGGRRSTMPKQFVVADRCGLLLHAVDHSPAHGADQLSPLSGR